MERFCKILRKEYDLSFGILRTSFSEVKVIVIRSNVISPKGDKYIEFNYPNLC